jgi:hypothetical protein
MISACVPQSEGLNTQTLPPETEAVTITVESTAAPTPERQEKVAYGASILAGEENALSYLETKLTEGDNVVYVYRDFSDAVNHFTQKAKIDDGNSSYVQDMNENWQEDPYSGSSSIKVTVETLGNSWGGWLFVNGALPKGETTPVLSFGEIPDTGLDLTGAKELVFEARGERGGEIVEFFTAGLGYDGSTFTRMSEYPDSTHKITLGFTTLTNEWKTYRIDLEGVDLSYIGCGFGFVLSGAESGDRESTFYLDNIRFEGPMDNLQGAPVFLQSYETNTTLNPDQIYIQNAAFSYDNALAAMAFLSAGKPEQAQRILDAFVFAIQNDRYQPDRVRNAYSFGDVRPFPGWESGARLPGWYDTTAKEYYEDEYQVGTNVGNSSYVALALLQYYRLYGGETYLSTAETIMEWVLKNCSTDTPGFTAGYDGWPEGGESKVTLFTYKSTEHNIDSYAVFKQLYQITGEEKYRLGQENALTFLQSMYDEQAGYFYTGTTEDGITPSKDNIVLDAQVWSLLALGNEGFAPYQKALDTAWSMKKADGGMPFHESSNEEGWWPEGTAFTAIALAQAERYQDSDELLNQLIGVQLASGVFPAATVAELPTGFNLFTGDPWVYSDTPHIAPTSWYIMAVNAFNPYEFSNE